MPAPVRGGACFVFHSILKPYQIRLNLYLPAGVMNGGRTVTDDICLYAEALALRAAQEQQSGVLQSQLTLGLRYYFGVAPLPVCFSEP